MTTEKNQHFSLKVPQKFTHIWIFWFENITPGNPVSELYSTLPMRSQHATQFFIPMTI
jgi:hypothetical protein